MCFGGGCQRETDASHAAAHIAPHSLFPVHLSKHMVPHHIDRPRCLRPDKAANDALAREGGTQVIGLKIVSQHIVEVAEHEIAVNLFVLAPETPCQISYRGWLSSKMGLRISEARSKNSRNFG